MHFFKNLKQFHFSGRQHWPWLTAGTVLCCAAWLAFSELPVQRTDNKTTSAKVRMLEDKLRAQAAAPVTTQQNLAAQLASFDSLSLVTADLQSLAAQNGLLMSDASFKPAADNQAANGIGRVEVNTRIKGAYLPLKKTLAAMLATHGGLALESLSMRRARASDVVMDIDVRFTYFYRKPS
ncbi:hypothetical protein SAMN03097694_2336 [Janthinobacterium lividum]|uniref:Uncharacterized protein n=1 Tax=Janthinobacterium lividum TaxID=29581 RepID=A0AB38C7B0_9BURK|nr:hypothetical protein [Janthinobacterium lividum]SFX46868.1 hypothetical protein SAMN03097694_2336 [Janthinobacterium lividum]